MEETILSHPRVVLCSFFLQSEPEARIRTKALTRSARSLIFLLCDTDPKAILIKTPTGKIQRCTDQLDSDVLSTETIFLTFDYSQWDILVQRHRGEEKHEVYVPIVFNGKEFLLAMEGKHPRVKDLVGFLFEQRFISVKENGVLLAPEEPLSWPNNTIQLEFQTSNKVVESVAEVLEQMQRVLDNDLTPAMLQQLRAFTKKMSYLINAAGEPVFEQFCSGGINAITVAASGLTMNVPALVSDQNHTFKITSVDLAKQQHVEALVPERVSPVYHLGPHNVEFKVPVELEFSVNKSLDVSKAAIYIQQEKEQHKELNAWLMLKPKILTNNKVSMKAKSFTYMFVAPEVEHVHGSITGSNSADVVRDGLNYRGKCQNSVCEMFEKFVTHHRGYGDGIEPNQEKHLMLCPKCTSGFAPRQIVFCNSVFKVSFKKVYGNAGLQTIEDQVVGSNLFLIGDPNVEEDTNYVSFFIDCRKSVYNPSVGNNNVNSDAAVDGAFDGMTHLIGVFYHEVASCFDHYAGAALKKKGFKYTMVQDEGEFVTKLPHFDIAWVISDQQLKNSTMGSSLATACLAHHKKGKGLYIWGDNDPYFVHANLVLNAIFPGVALMGNTPGSKNLTLSYTLTTGTFLPNHIITTGVPALCEGYTICYPNKVTGFSVLAQSSDGHPCIMYAEKTSGSGRVVIDCGFTKLFYNWDSVGTPRYTNNAACWLAGYSVTSQYYLSE